MARNRVRLPGDPILLELRVDPAVADEAELRVAIHNELDCEIVADRAVQHGGELAIVSVADSKVSVTYRGTHDQEPLTRVVTLPRGKEQRTQWIAWLVGNLARDEASDWLADHGREESIDVQSGSGKQAEVDHTTDEPAALDAANVEPSQAHSAPHRGSTEVVLPALSANEPTLARRTFNLSIWYKWLQLRPSSAETRFTLHLGAGYGRVGAIRGAGFDLLHHRVDHELQGVAGSFIWTRVPQTQGLAWSAGVVTASGSLRGVDLAWLFAYRDATHSEREGNSVASFRANLDMVGVQAGGIGAWSSGTFVGAQGAGLFTKHQGPIRGFQVSLGANVTDAVVGAQFAAMNWAGSVHGLQIGLVNYARHVDGVAIGLINISENVRVQVLPWVERNYHGNLGIRYAYDVLTFGYSIGHDAATDRTRVLFGLGTILRWHRVALAPSINVGYFAQKSDGRGPARGGHENDIRVALEWEIVPKRLGIMGGPTLALRSDPDAARMKWVPRWFVGLTLL